MEQWDCARCGKTCERKRVRGQKPKWCGPACASLKTLGQITCAHCGGTGAATHRRQRYCSLSCGNAARPRPPRKPKAAPIEVDQRSPLRRSIEDRDLPAMRRALASSSTQVGACWVWSGRTSRDGYPEINAGRGRRIGLHRAIPEAVEGAPLGVQAAHHKCGNSLCVNPDHLQPVTARDNTAEMLARHAYVQRIQELEAVLATVAPGHPVLDRIPLSA